ncbi:unnamed protein product [Effrenium voratum]|nr:unnamed protein product [Effrenium voratum]
MSLPGIHEIAPNKVCVWMTASTLEVRIVDLQGANWCYVAQELWGHINPESPPQQRLSNDSSPDNDGSNKITVRGLALCITLHIDSWFGKLLRASWLV